MDASKWEQLIDSMTGEVKPLIINFVASTLQDIGQDTTEYAEDVTESLMGWIIRNAESPPITINRELHIVRATLQNIAMKHAINANTRTLTMVDNLIEILARALVTTLRIALA